VKTTGIVRVSSRRALTAREPKATITSGLAMTSAELAAWNCADRYGGSQLDVHGIAPPPERAQSLSERADERLHLRFGKLRQHRNAPDTSALLAGSRSGKPGQGSEDIASPCMSGKEHSEG